MKKIRIRRRNNPLCVSILVNNALLRKSMTKAMNFNLMAITMGILLSGLTLTACHDDND